MAPAYGPRRRQLEASSGCSRRPLRSGKGRRGVAEWPAGKRALPLAYASVALSCIYGRAQPDYRPTASTDKGIGDIVKGRRRSHLQGATVALDHRQTEPVYAVQYALRVLQTVDSH